jgi:hypothetical protein
VPDIVSTCLVLHSLCKFLVTNSMMNGYPKLLQCVMTHYMDHVLQGICRKKDIQLQQQDYKLFQALRKMPKKHMNFANKKQQKNFKLLCHQEISIPQYCLQEDSLAKSFWNFKKKSYIDAAFSEEHGADTTSEEYYFYYLCTNFIIVSCINDGIDIFKSLVNFRVSTKFLLLISTKHSSKKSSEFFFLGITTTIALIGFMFSDSTYQFNSREFRSSIVCM